MRNLESLHNPDAAVEGLTDTQAWRQASISLPFMLQVAEGDCGALPAVCLRGSTETSSGEAGLWL